MTLRLSTVLAFLGAFAPLRAASPQILQSFDEPGGTPYKTASCLDPPTEVAPVLVDGGPTEVGRFQRIAFETPVPNHQSLTFDYVDPGSFDQVVADFDFRMTPGQGQADGIGFALLSIEEFGLAGFECPREPLFAAEEPNLAKSIGIGFDIHQAPGADLNNNHVSIHYDGIEQSEFDVTPAISLAASEWIHARILVSPGNPSGIDLTILLAERGGRPFTVVDGFSLSWVEPYPSRVHFAARSGGESASHDLDNVEVRYMDSTESFLSFSAVSYDAVEAGLSARVTVTRRGTSASTVTAAYGTLDGVATGSSDYVPSFGTLTFQPGEMGKSFSVPLADDPLNEGDETFLVFLENPAGGAVLAGPSTAGVRIVDDESARLVGHWSRIVSLPTVAVHSHLLPTGKVLFWQEGGAVPKVYLWDPVTGETTPAAAPPYDIFCSGHSFLADGRLLVTGGHEHMDGVGLRDATIYNPGGSWQSDIPLMGGEGGRWYPTNTTLGSGDVLVLSGSFDANFAKNTLPQVFDVDDVDWLDLDCAQELEPLGEDLYPRMFLAPDGRVMKVGDPRTWFLDVSGCGQWLEGPPSVLPQARTYGPAVFYDGKILILGGGGDKMDPDPPTDSVELIDLNEASPRWVEVAPMASPRRHHNATLLPDGTTLVTGGSSCRDNCAAGAVLEAELWDPSASSWTTLSSMVLKRLYHSIALLLPDGRVLSAGGGRPAADGEVDHHNAEIFSPPYLFKGPRPSITFAPDRIGWGRSFYLATPNAANIGKVSLVRLGSVTHAFDQNQRFLSLFFTETAGGLTVAVPSSSHLAPPGHYMLFVLDHDGVPSVAKTVRVGHAPSVLLRINGSASDVVLTTPAALTATLDMASDTYRDPVDWYYAILIGGTTYWVSSTGIRNTPAPLLASVPPIDLTGAVLWDVPLPAGSAITFLVFLVSHGTGVVALDFASAFVVP